MKDSIEKDRLNTSTTTWYLFRSIPHHLILLSTLARMSLITQHPAIAKTPDRFVMFLHPGYEDSFNTLCVLPATDNGGVHFGTALTVCGIIANNAFNGWFAKERDATPEERVWDSVLCGDKFYFFVSDNSNGIIPGLARDA
jgi:hypothetical protein